jgi:hypothetical protein
VSRQNNFAGNAKKELKMANVTKLTVSTIPVHTNGSGSLPAVITPANPAEEEIPVLTTAKIGLDLGNSQVKAAQVVQTKNGPRIVTKVFESAFALPLELGNGDDTGLTGRAKATLFTHVTPDGESNFFVGNEAKYGREKTRIPTEDGRIVGLSDLRLMLYTVTVQFKIRAKLDEPAPRVYIYAGLPLHLADRGKEVAAAWQGVHQVKINGRPYHVEVAGVKTMSQPHGGLTDHFFLETGDLNPERKATLKGTTGIIDVGYRTTDIVRLKYDPTSRTMLVDQEFSLGLNDLGAQNFYRLVYRAILERHRRNLDDDTLTQAVQDRRFRNRGQDVEIGDIVDAAAEQIAESLASAVVEKAGWTDEIVAQTDTILAIGGTPLLLGKALKRRLHYVEIPANAPVSCAHGLAKAAIMRNVFPDFL